MLNIEILLKSVSSEEREGLQKILDSKSNEPKDIIEDFWYNCQSIFGYTFGSEPPYNEILLKVCKKLKITESQNQIDEEIEILIAQKVMKTVWEKMTPEQRNKLDKKLRETSEKYDKGGALASSVSVFGALTAAQLSGFGVYLLASTTLGAITGAIGLTLPFAVYTSMSSAIAIVIGPVGWIGAGLFAIWKLTGPNYKKLIPAIIYISALRAKEEGDFK